MKKQKVKLPAHGVRHKVPSKVDVLEVALKLKAPVYEDGRSSPELTAWYVREFCRMNHLKHPEAGQ